ncbi:TPA: translation initiation factor IF-2 [candidate division WWE3 bacterium]|uniref:Translation initiation factor IF-2 n=3 Tax=Katanobacteria TaxID=422282 RepID=A0A1F4V3R5_UNCKA|nr:MAG: Translation initiation factor IF-2 [candidate division WWE3 bacterium GW2011_GWB1_44_4]OGC51798.1 MAG: translation initiation factor IF-2 [candidate division WWE3 bacterium RIFCSPHIGHO2_01_FULL_43_9]HAZ29788.1 translation initiation factor IF-2 [candidate division WWE3 bacterium]
MQISEPTGKYAKRPPIVSVMGHVDHGKTSLLDAIRKTNVADKEYAGITQHIGAYQAFYKDNPITFIDTPGHEAFAAMRARGGKAADIVVLVVAGTEGVMPQTREAIAHARSGGAKIIVALTKCDLEGFDAQKTKQQLAQENVLAEDWGGDIICVDVSAKTGSNIDKLLESIVTLADLMELKAEPNGEIEALIIEAKVDSKKGAVATAIIKNGTLKVGDEVSAGRKTAKIKLLSDFLGKPVKEAGPGTPVEILGFKEPPSIGDTVVQKGSLLESLSQEQNRVEIVGKNTKKKVSVVLKADTQGTLEAVKTSLAKIAVESPVANFSLEFLSTGTGDIAYGDVLMADSAKGVVLGFAAKANTSVMDLAESHGVIVKNFQTIYELIDYVEKLLSGALSIEEQKVKGRAEVLKTFKLESGDVILGCKVIAGILKEEQKIYIYNKNPADLKKEDEPVYTGNIKKIKEGKNDVASVAKGKECGLLLKPQYTEVQTGYYIEVR